MATLRSGARREVVHNVKRNPVCGRPEGEDVNDLEDINPDLASHAPESVLEDDEARDEVDAMNDDLRTAEQRGK